MSDWLARKFKESYENNNEISFTLSAYKKTATSLLITLGYLTIMSHGHAQHEFAHGNTAGGHGALDSLTTGTQNTALGAGALHKNTKGNHNTAVGSQSLRDNSEADANTAVGSQALSSNTSGTSNTATGNYALVNNTTGHGNTADGRDAMILNTTGDVNTAIGQSALFGNRSGSRNVAIGAQAMNSAKDPVSNTAVGVNALSRSAGAFNIGLGYLAGSLLTTGDNNICIENRGEATDSGTIRIGSANHVRTFIAGISGARVSGGIVQVNAAGQLGTAPSSARFKHEIKPMDTASEAIFALNPVTFFYNQDIDPQATPQFGLIAEEVAKVNPALVLPDKERKPFTVRYDAVNAMLLNEFLKEHRTVEQQERELAQQETTIAQLKSAVTRQEATVAEQRKEIAVLAAGLQKVSAQVEMKRTAPQLVGNNQ